MKNSMSGALGDTDLILYSKLEFDVPASSASVASTVRRLNPMVKRRMVKKLEKLPLETLEDIKRKKFAF